MATVTIDLKDEEYRELADAAARREMAPDALVQRWVRERLVHEKERAAGGGKAMSPRARRRAEEGA